MIRSKAVLWWSCILERFDDTVSNTLLLCMYKRRYSASTNMEPKTVLFEKYKRGM